MKFIKAIDAIAFESQVFKPLFRHSDLVFKQQHASPVPQLTGAIEGE